MFGQNTALIVIDAQETFRHRDYWNEAEAAPFIQRLQALHDGAKRAGIAIAQVFHVDPEGVFSLASGHVKTLAPLAIAPDTIIHKHRHSALVGSPLGLGTIGTPPCSISDPPSCVEQKAMWSPSCNSVDSVAARPFTIGRAPS